MSVESAFGRYGVVDTGDSPPSGSVSTGQTINVRLRGRGALGSEYVSELRSDVDLDLG